MIRELAEDLLARFADLPLLSSYNVYQRLLDYWDDVMQDDVYMIAAEGWVGAAKPRSIIEDGERKIKEMPDLVIGRKKYKLDLVPPQLVVARYFAQRQAAIEELRAAHEAAAQVLEEFVEEHSGDEGLLEDAVNDKGKVTKASVRERLKELRKARNMGEADESTADELVALEQCLALSEAEDAADKAVKEAQAKLDVEVLARYTTLTTEEEALKTLVIDDKWLATMQAIIVERYFAGELAAITSEVQRLTQGLIARVKELEERYAHPLPELEREVERLSMKVEAHLKQMGLVWR